MEHNKAGVLLRWGGCQQVIKRAGATSGGPECHMSACACLYANMHVQHRATPEGEEVGGSGVAVL